jgi:hypothetical protein
MTDQVKVLAVEINGVDLEDSVELDLMDYVLSLETDHHAGWDEIIDSQVVEILSRKQMVVFDELKLDGELRVEGKLIIEV